MKTDQRSRAEEFGRRAEFWAKYFLLLKGFRTINERFKARGGEIDLIVKRGKTLAFVEVKARRNSAMLEEAFEGVRKIGSSMRRAISCHNTPNIVTIQ